MTNFARESRSIQPEGARISPKTDATFEAGQAELLRINAEAEVGVGSPKGNVFSYAVMTRRGPSYDSDARVDDLRRVIDRLSQRLQSHPEEMLNGLTLIAGNNFYHRPIMNSELKGFEFFVRSTAPPALAMSVRPPLGPIPELPTGVGRIVAELREENVPGFKGFVSDRGDGFALLEHVGHTGNPERNIIGFDNLVFCMLQAHWDRTIGRDATRLATSLTQPMARFLPEIPAPVPLYSSLIRFKADPRARSEVPIEFPSINSENVWDVYTAKSRVDNARSEEGLVAPNGFFWAYPAMVGEPLLEAPVTPLAVQNERFLRILWEWANAHPDLEIRGSHYKKLVGPFLKDPLNASNMDRNHQEVPMWESFLRGRDSRVPLPTRDPEKAARSGGKRIFSAEFLDPKPELGVLAPNPPKTFASDMAWNQRRQGLPGEGLVPSPYENQMAISSDHWLNRYGEGFCFFEFSEPPLQAGERSLVDQRWEVVKRFREWHKLSPFMEITESHFWQGHFAEFMDSGIYSNQRDFVFRIRDFDWDSVSPEERERISSRTRDFKLPLAKTGGGVFTQMHLTKMKSCWVGTEGDDGRGWAIIDLVVPFPSKGNDGVRQTNAQFARLCAHWGETFWWREITATEVLREWSGHQGPDTPEESFAYTLFINFKRRNAPEALKVDGPSEIRRILSEGKFPWDETYARDAGVI